MQKNFILGLLCCLFALHSAQAQPKKSTPKPMPKKAVIADKGDVQIRLNAGNIKQIISLLTIEEKARLLIGTGMKFDAKGQIIGKYQNKVQGAAGTTYPIARLGIPTIVLCDGPAGLRILPKRSDDATNTYYCTAFPIATMLASTWNTELVQSVGEAMGNEVLEYGADVLLAPALNIHRNPLGGRNFEYYSEDPLIAGKTAAAMINGIQSQGVGTSIKHFAANNHETERNNINVIASPRTLREIYLEGFRIAVEDAQPWTVMSSYNKINGVHTAERKDLLTDILRNDWGFKGLVMTDWYGRDHAIDQQNAGNDLLMPGVEPQYNAILEGIKSGKISQQNLDRNIENLLNLIVKTPSFKNYKHTNKPDLKAHAEVARRAAAEGSILLKNNDNTLPLSPETKTIAAFGNASYENITGGSGSGDVNELYSVSLEQGLQNAGLTLTSNLKKTYNTFITDAKANRVMPVLFFMPAPPIAEMKVTQEMITTEAKTADVALITIGRNSGEFSDRPLSDFYLTDDEKELIQNVTKIFAAQGKKTIVVMNIGNVIEVESWRNTPDAILLAWQGGQEAGNAIADVLTGKVNPSGRLATSFATDYNQIESSKNFPGEPKEKPISVNYTEALNIGYRNANMPVSYAFGYGLSYTNFEITNIKTQHNAQTNEVTIRYTVQNTGAVAGKEVIQVYMSLPTQDTQQPAKKLVAFAKTNTLQPQQSVEMKFIIKPRDYAYFNEEKSGWMLDAGSYTAHVGTAVNAITQSTEFTIQQPILVQRQNPALLPATPTATKGDVIMPNFE
jgi:beta-glucosidase